MTFSGAHTVDPLQPPKPAPDPAELLARRIKKTRRAVAAKGREYLRASQKLADLTVELLAMTHSKTRELDATLNVLGETVMGRLSQIENSLAGATLANLSSRIASLESAAPPPSPTTARRARTAKPSPGTSGAPQPESPPTAGGSSEPADPPTADAPSSPARAGGQASGPPST
jgi:hypothetical protein